MIDEIEKDVAEKTDVIAPTGTDVTRQATDDQADQDLRR